LYSLNVSIRSLSSSKRSVASSSKSKASCELKYSIDLFRKVKEHVYKEVEGDDDEENV
jgi:hypothetical protein